MTINKRVAIYKTGEDGDVRFNRELTPYKGLETFFITAQEIKQGGLSEADVLVMPGCHSGQAAYREPLGNLGFKTIEEATTKKGLHVLGVCGGAYVLSANIDWYYHGNKKTVHNAHALFAGQCTGPIHPYRGGQGHLPFVTHKICKSYKALSPLAPSKLDVIYWGGGDFIWNEQEHPNVQILYYREFDQKPAIIQMSLGQGKVTLSNVHPEVSYYNIAPEGLDALTSDLYTENLPDIVQIKDQLAAHNKQRKNLLRHLIL